MKWRSLEESMPGTDTRSLQDIFAERKELIARYVPPEVQAIHLRVITELKEASGRKYIAGRRQDPCLRTPGPQRKARIIDRSAGQGPPRDLLFSRALVSLLCRTTGSHEPGSAPDRRSGALLVAISPQTVQQSYFMADQHKLRFPLLSDAGNQVARQFGLVYRVPDDQQAIYRRAFVNLPFANGDQSWELPIPATFIVDRDGTILSASADEDYTRAAGAPGNRAPAVPAPVNTIRPASIMIGYG